MPHSISNYLVPTPSFPPIPIPNPISATRPEAPRTPALVGVAPSADGVIADPGGWTEVQAGGAVEFDGSVVAADVEDVAVGPVGEEDGPAVFGGAGAGAEDGR